MRDKNNRELFEIMPVARAVRTMAVPAIIGQLIVLIYNMADTFFVGRTNNPSMVAGASLILPVFNISLSVASLAGVGGGAMISRLLGMKREDEAKRVCGFSVYLSAALALVFEDFVSENHKDYYYNSYSAISYAMDSVSAFLNGY